MMSRKKAAALMAAIVIALFLTLPITAYAGDKWLGTDDLVDRKMKEVAGVTKKEPLIDISQGNLGLFIFTVGGFAAGTVFGYHWRKLLKEKAGNKNGQ